MEVDSNSESRGSRLSSDKNFEYRHVVGLYQSVSGQRYCNGRIMNPIGYVGCELGCAQYHIYLFELSFLFLILLLANAL